MIKEIKEIVDEILLKSGSQVEVKLESKYPGSRFAGGKYSMGTHTVTLYIEEIKEQCFQIFQSHENLIDYIKVVFAHELGHAEDSKLTELVEKLDGATSEFESAAISLLIEQNAWDYAEKILTDVNPAFIKNIIYYSLLPYHQRLQPEPA